MESTKPLFAFANINVTWCVSRVATNALARATERADRFSEPTAAMLAAQVKLTFGDGKHS